MNHQGLRTIAYGTLRDFGIRHPPVMPAINAWYKIASCKDVVWQKPQDVVKTFGVSWVDVLRCDRVCINLSGNKVRLFIKVEYGYGMAFVRCIGWHKDYDSLGNNIHLI